ncbi:MAG: lipopolysaccharide biosynthesis protein [Terriglobales bacterium]
MNRLETQPGEIPFPSFSHWLRGAVLANYGAVGVSLLCSAVTIPIYLKYLGAENFGIYTLAISLAVLLQLPFSGLDVSASRLVSRSSQGDQYGMVKSLLRAGLLPCASASALLSAIAAAALLAVPRPLLPGALQASIGGVSSAFAIACLGIPARCASHLVEGICNGLFRFRTIAALNVVSGIFQTIASIYVVLAGYGVVGLVLVWTVVGLLELVAQLTVVLVAARGYSGPLQPSWPLLKDLAGQTGWLSVEAGVDGIQTEADKFIIVTWASAAAAGYYAIAFRIPMMLLMMVGQYTTLYVPVAAAADAAGRRGSLASVFLRANRHILIVFVPVAAALAVWARPLLTWWLGPYSAEIVPLLRIGLAIAGIHAISEVMYPMLRGLNYSRELGVVSCWQAGLRIAVSLMLVHRFGAVGVALAVLISVLISEWVLRWRLVRKALEVSFGTLMKALLLPSLAAGGVLVAGFSLALIQVHLAGKVVLTTASLLLFAWVIGRMPAVDTVAAKSQVKIVAAGRGA